MALNLDGLISQMAGLLADTGRLTWTDDLLAAGLRQALEAWNLACGTGYTLAGLDGAAETSLPAGQAAILVLGGAGYALQGRLARRAEVSSLPPGLAGQLANLARAYLEDFREQVERVRLAGLRKEAGPPWGAWEDREPTE